MQALDAGRDEVWSVAELDLLGSPVQRPRMLNEKALHNVAGKTQERGPFLVASRIAAAIEGLDLDQRQVQLVHQKGRLPGMLAALTLHFGCCQLAQFRVKQFHQAVGGCAVSVTKICHQTGNGAWRKRIEHREYKSVYQLKKDQIFIAGFGRLLSLYSVRGQSELRTSSFV
jgi:hypothetical protein